MPLDPIQLDDRSYEQLLTETLARIPVHTPEWTNFNDSDPGITIVQLFAFMTENLLYRSNRIPEANRRKFLTLLGLNLQPASPARGLVAFSNDRGPVKPLPFDTGQTLLAGKVQFRTRTDVNILPVTTVAYYKKPQTDLDTTTRQQYQMLFQTFLNSNADQLQFYTATQLEAPQNGKPLAVVDLNDPINGTIDRSLWIALVAPPNVPLDTVRSAIGGQTLSLGIYPSLQSDGRVLMPLTSEDSKQVQDTGLVFEIAAPGNAPTGASGPVPAKYTRLVPDYAENVLEYPGIVSLPLPASDKLVLWDFDTEEEGTGDYPPLVEDKGLAQRILTWIRISLPKTTTTSTTGANDATFTSVDKVQTQEVRNVGPSNLSQQHTRLSWVGGNAARVMQAVLVEKEILGIGTGAPDQVYKVANVPILLQESQQAVPDGSPSTTLIVEVQDPNGNWEQWTMTDDLFAALPTDTVYAVDPEAGTISFGSGLRGYRPPAGSYIRITYEYGGGLQGQVPIGAISKGPTLQGGFSVANPLATWGAAESQSVADGESSIPNYLRHRDRLVTINDFRDITLQTPGVQVGRVEVLPLFNPDLFDPNNVTQTWPGTLTVLVIPQFDDEHPDAPEPNRLFLDTVCNWLDPRRLVTTEIHVRGPDYIPIWVSVGIVTMAGQTREVVLKRVMDAISNYLSPLTGGTPNDTPITLESDLSSSSSTGGTGWPLSTDIRKQDLEAVATRVAGVRYVDSIYLGMLPSPASGGLTLTDVESVPLVGLQLPVLSGIAVREGPADDLGDIFGQQPPQTPPTVVPVPVLPKQC